MSIDYKKIQTEISALSKQIKEKKPHPKRFIIQSVKVISDTENFYFDESEIGESKSEQEQLMDWDYKRRYEDYKGGY